MDIWYTLMLPFTWLLKTFYSLFNNYGIAIILFSLAIKVILFPLSLKGKKSMIAMNMLSGQMQKLQKQYANNQAKYQEEVAKLYEKEGVNPSGGCLWSMVPLLILFPIYAVVRRPLKYWLGLSQTAIEAVTAAVTGAGVTLSRGYPEIDIVSKLFTDSGLLSTAQAAAPEAEIYGINMNFLGIDLASTPNWKFWEGGVTWNSVGLLLIVALCAGTALLSSVIMMKTNQMNNPQAANQQTAMMTWMSPLMMLWFGFIMPGAMGVYIISNSVFMTIQELICAQLLKKDYAKAKAERERREQEEKEEEKRQRREKAEAKAKAAEEARKNKSRQKELDAAEDAKIPPEVREASRSGMRQYARGRAYDPKRYGDVTPYDEAAIERLLAEPVNPKKKKKKDQDKD